MLNFANFGTVSQDFASFFACMHVDITDNKVCHFDFFKVKRS